MVCDTCWEGEPSKRESTQKMVAASAAGRSTRALLMNEGKDDEASWWIPAVRGGNLLEKMGLKMLNIHAYIYIYMCDLFKTRAFI